MRKVGIGANEKQADQTVPYAVHMEAVEEIERLRVMVEEMRTENEALKAAKKDPSDKK